MCDVKVRSLTYTTSVATELTPDFVTSFGCRASFAEQLFNVLSNSRVVHNHLSEALDSIKVRCVCCY